jgi:hypothetical protein
MTLEHVDTVFAFSVVMLLFSMVITVLVQMVVAISGLRGRNLIWGVTKVLECSPDLREHAVSIANAALTHPAVTVSRRPAATIGSSELMAVLRDLADPSNPSLGDQASKALTEALERTVPEASRVHAEKLVDQFNELFPDESRRMQEAVRVLSSKAGQLTNDFDSWFDTIMNRTTDRFILHTRAWTIVFAILIAFRASHRFAPVDTATLHGRRDARVVDRYGGPDAREERGSARGGFRSGSRTCGDR